MMIRSDYQKEIKRIAEYYKDVSILELPEEFNGKSLVEIYSLLKLKCLVHELKIWRAQGAH